jgi:hypothetical protein
VANTGYIFNSDIKLIWPFLNTFSTDMTYQGNQCWIYCFPVMANPSGQCWIYCSSVMACQGDHSCIYCPTEKWPINVTNPGYNVFQWWWTMLDILSISVASQGGQSWIYCLIAPEMAVQGGQCCIYCQLEMACRVTSAGYTVLFTSYDKSRGSVLYKWSIRDGK